MKMEGNLWKRQKIKRQERDEGSNPREAGRLRSEAQGLVADIYDTTVDYAQTLRSIPPAG